MPATPFRPFYDDYGCNRDRQIGQVGGFARVRREHELETQRIMNEHHQQQSLPDVVALDVPDSVPVPRIPTYQQQDPPNALILQQTNATTITNQNTTYIITILLLLLAVLTQNISNIQYLLDNSFSPHADYWVSFSLALAIFSCILSIIIGAAVLTTCVYYRDTELPNLISVFVSICAYIIPIINILLAIVFPKQYHR